MEQTTNPNPYPENQGMPAAPQRPSFLTTLCILSFIMSGIMILLGIWGVIKSLMPLSAEEQMAIDMMKGMGNDISAMVKNPTKEILSLVAQLLSLFGVIMMWKTKKIGFYIYTAAELIPYILTIAMSGLAGINAMAGAFGTAAAAAAYIVLILMFLIDAAFIIMYAVNLKHMK